MVKDKAYYSSMTEEIIGCAFRVGNLLGNGFLEKVYENALGYEIQKSGLKVKQQHPISVYYEGVVVGEYFADLIIGDSIIVELKAVSALDKKHFSQCMNYLKATGYKVALLINFGTSKVQVRRIVNSL
nr:GxxExxY protein [Pelobacter seleniigenes]